MNNNQSDLINKESLIFLIISFSIVTIGQGVYLFLLLFEIVNVFIAIGEVVIYLILLQGLYFLIQTYKETYYGK